VGFAIPVFVTGVHIFETNEPGSVVSVSVWNYELEEFVVVYKELVDRTVTPKVSRILSPEMTLCTFKSDRVRIDLDCVTAASWSEIDCVMLCGADSLKWATSMYTQLPDYFQKMIVTMLLLRHKLSLGKEQLPKDILFEIFTHCLRNWTPPSVSRKSKGSTCLLS